MMDWAHPEGRIIYSNPEFDFVQIGNEQSIGSTDTFVVLQSLIPPGKKIHRISVEEFLLWTDSNFNFIITIEHPEYRKTAIDHLEKNSWSAISVIMPYAIVWPTVKIGRGVVVWGFCGILSNAVIGDYCTIGGYSGVAHNSTLGTNCKLQTNSQILGSCNIGNDCLIGSRSTVSPEVTLPAYSTLIAYSALTKSPDTPGVFGGTPARRISNIDVE
jgi:acetyltransferase-like isoleucine patch superfamily enzyme